MELPGENVRLRSLALEDVPRLVELGADESVSRWWPDLSGDKLRGKVEQGHAFAIEADGELAGMIQWHEEEHPDFRSAGIDLFLGAPFQGRGLGPDAVRTVARWLVETRGHHRLTIDPAAANERAVRSYEKAGFRRVGVMRRYWRGPDGVWQDGVLLDLLAEELER